MWTSHDDDDRDNLTAFQAVDNLAVNELNVLLALKPGRKDLLAHNNRPRPVTGDMRQEREKRQKTKSTQTRAVLIRSNNQPKT